MWEGRESVLRRTRRGSKDEWTGKETGIAENRVLGKGITRCDEEGEGR